jgi:lysophospholipase L1-like esterase
MPSDEAKSDSTAARKTSKVFRFLICITIALVVAAALVAGILYFNCYLPQGKGPAGPDVPAEPFQHIWSTKTILLLGIGDSITDGFGAKDGFSYFDRLVKNPPGDNPDISGKNLSVVFPNLTIQNVASSGSNSIDHYVVIESLRKQPQDVFGIIVMTTGGNDLIHDYGRKPPIEGAMYGATIEQARPWIDSFRERLDEMVTRLQDIFPGGCHIFLANIYDPTDGTGDTSAWLTKLPAWPEGLSILESYNQTISRCADKYDNVHLVDIHKLFLGHGINCRKFWLDNYDSSDPTYWYYLNTEDPGERGHDAIRRLFLLEMIKVFAEPNKSQQ